MVRRLEPASGRSRAASFLIFLAVALGVSFPYFEGIRNANEVPRIMQAMAVWDTGQWAIDGPGGRRLDPGPDVARSRVDHRLYPNKPPGVSLVLAPVYGIARAVHGDTLSLRQLTWWARFATGWLPTMVLCTFAVRRLTRQFSRPQAIGAVTLYALGTPAQSYAHLAYGHQLAAALLFIGLGLVIDAAVVDLAVARTRRVLLLAALGGALAAAAVGVEYGAAFAGVPIGLFLLWRARTPARMPVTLAALGGALVPIVALGAYHAKVFGSPLSTGYHHVINVEFAKKHGEGFLGLGLPKWDMFHAHFLSADGGLLWWAPLVVLAVYGLARASGHTDEPTRSESRLWLATLLLYVLVISSLSFEGGWRVGPRYMVAVLPMTMLGLGEALGQVKTDGPWTATVVMFGVYALIINTLAANLWPHLDLTNIHNPISEVLVPLWNEGVEPYSVVRSAFGVESLRAIVVLCVVGGALALARNFEMRPATISAFAFGVVAAVLLVAATKHWPKHPKGRRNLAYIVRSWEPDPQPQARDESRELPPLAPGVVDRGPARRHKLVPPR